MPGHKTMFGEANRISKTMDRRKVAPAVAAYSSVDSAAKYGSPAVQTSTDSSRIRSKYLHRLGITTPKMSPKRLSQRLSPPAKVEALKNDHGELDETITISSPPLHSPLQEKSMVCFDSAVIVHPIPNRTDYSDRVRKSIWMHRRELEENAARNVLEFAAENWDWRQVCEEMDMIVIEDQLVHPVHLIRQCSLKRQFLLIMSAQRHGWISFGFKQSFIFVQSWCMRAKGWPLRPQHFSF